MSLLRTTQVVFRPAREEDRRVFDWVPHGIPHVVTVGGSIVLMMRPGRTRPVVIYQSGADGISDLIRAASTLVRALEKGVKA